jgi:hypothetical protein
MGKSSARYKNPRYLQHAQHNHSMGFSFYSRDGLGGVWGMRENGIKPRRVLLAECTFPVYGRGTKLGLVFFYFFFTAIFLSFSICGRARTRDTPKMKNGPPKWSY